MSITQTSLAEILGEHVRLEVESIDRMYLNVYIPKLQRESGASWFLRQGRKYPAPSLLFGFCLRGLPITSCECCSRPSWASPQINSPQAR